MSESTRKTFFVCVGIVLLVLVGLWWYSGFSLDFMRFFASEPDVTPTQGVEIVQCNPLTQTVRVGAAVTVSATRGAGYRWFAPEGNPAIGGGSFITTSYATVGTKKVTVASARSDGSANIDDAACTVVVTP